MRLQLHQAMLILRLGMGMGLDTVLSRLGMGLHTVPPRRQHPAVPGMGLLPIPPRQQGMARPATRLHTLPPRRLRPEVPAMGLPIPPRRRGMGVAALRQARPTHLLTDPSIRRRPPQAPIHPRPLQVTRVGTQQRQVTAPPTLLRQVTRRLIPQRQQQAPIPQ
jgi:hypothetical protein